MRGIIPLIFLAIAIGGWIVNLINSQNHPPPPNRRRRDNRDGAGRVQNEIEQFLDEARRARQGRQGGQPDDGIEVMEQGRRRPPAQERSREEIWREQTRTAQAEGNRSPKEYLDRHKNRRNRKKEQPVQKSAPSVAGTGKAPPPLPGTRPASKPSVFDQPVASPVPIGQVSSRHLSNDVGQEVKAHMGVFSAEAEGSSGMQSQRMTKVRQSGAVTDLRRLLASPGGVRNAIILSEILQPPLSRRKPS